MDRPNTRGESFPVLVVEIIHRVEASDLGIVGAAVPRMMGQSFTAGHAAVRGPSKSVADLGDEADDKETTAVDSQCAERALVERAMAGAASPQGIRRSVGTRPLPPRPRGSIQKKPASRASYSAISMLAEPAKEVSVQEPQFEQVQTMDIVEILPTLDLREPPAPKADKLVVARTVFWFGVFVATALLRWPLRALPHLRAFVAQLEARLQVEWQRAAGRATRTR